MELPAMAEGLLGEEEEESSWEPPVRNLDKFFSSMYQYHNTKGLPTILITQICSIISLGFTASFSTFLLGFVDWAALKNCHDESSCGNITNYVATNPFRQFSFIRNLFIFFYSMLLSTFWMWKTYHSFNIVKRAIQMEKFYREKLGIKVSELQTFEWDEIVQRLIRLHDHGIHRVVIKDKLNEHDVVLRIMRKDNYMIGLINKNILDLRVPWWIAPFISERLFLTKSLEWSLSFCIMEYIFNDQFKISSLFLKDIQGIKCIL
jgi:autophagy-related protein 9